MTTVFVGKCRRPKDPANQVGITESAIRLNHANAWYMLTTDLRAFIAMMYVGQALLNRNMLSMMPRWFNGFQISCSFLCEFFS
jgi:hypothetical protein